MMVEKNKNKILVVGSVATDLIFPLYGKIQDELIQPIESQQNLMFNAKRKFERYGGTGGNISYGLGLLGAKPLLFSVAGKDFEYGFRGHLEKRGVIAKVFVDKENFTANFYGMSDEKGQQIGVWQPNAYEKADTASLLRTVRRTVLRTVSHAIFSAGTGKSTLKHMQEFRKIAGPQPIVFFDPGQVLSILYSPEMFEKTARLANVFIGNEVEFKQAETLLGFSKEKLFTLGLSMLIETKGGEGSIIYTKDGSQIKIPAIKAKKIVETTGAGDAYRAGLLYGLSQGFGIEKSAKIGAYLASQSIMQSGAQEYTIEKSRINR